MREAELGRPANGGPAEVAALISALSARPGTREPGHFWPFSVRAAIAAVPVTLLALVIGFAISRTAAGWPDKRWDGWVLVGILVFSLVPVALVTLDGLARGGGSIDIRGVIRIAFAAAAAKPTETVPRNIGVPPGMSIADSGNVQILDALRRARTSEIAVVELEDGQAWWGDAAAGALLRSREAASAVGSRLRRDRGG